MAATSSERPTPRGRRLPARRASSATAISNRVAKVVVMVRADPSSLLVERPQTRRQQLVWTANRLATAVRKTRRSSASDFPQRRSEGGWSPAPGPRSSDEMRPSRARSFLGRLSGHGSRAAWKGRPRVSLFHLWAQPPSGIDIIDILAAQRSATPEHRPPKTPTLGDRHRRQ